MKNTILTLTIIALVISIAWTISSNYDYEPIILTITLVISIIGLLVYGNNQKTNKVKVLGIGHKVNVDTKNKNQRSQKNNKVDVDGHYSDVNIETENQNNS